MNGLPKKAGRRPGYTLLELLISVLIFSGIIILAIAAFARSADSAAKSNTVRNQVQAARSVSDQLTNDLHYVDTTDQVASLSSSCGETGTPFIGVRVSTALGCDEMELLIKYPGATGTNDLVWRLYAAKSLNGRSSIYVYEERGLSVCTLNGSSVIASNPSPCTAASAPTQASDLLASNYLVDGSGGLTPVFSGLDILSAQTASVAPYVKVDFNIKPAADTASSCSALAAGVCYTLETTIIPGND